MKTAIGAAKGLTTDAFIISSPTFLISFEMISTSFFKFLRDYLLSSLESTTSSFAFS